MNTKNRVMIASVGLLSITLAVAATAGPSKAESRTVPRFSAVEVRGALHAEISVRPEQSVEVSGDADLVPRIVTEVRGDRLIVRPPEGLRHSPGARSILVRIAAPRLGEVDVSGASEAKVSGLNGSALSLRASGASQVAASGLRGGRLQVDVSGASTLDLTGEGTELKAELSGASQLRARELKVAAAAVDASGASQAEVCATRTLGVELSGASDLSYYCKPQLAQRSLSGASSIREGGAR